MSNREITFEELLAILRTPKSAITKSVPVSAGPKPAERRSSFFSRKKSEARQIAPNFAKRRGYCTNTD
jgi:hypothetical protein